MKNKINFIVYYFLTKENVENKCQVEEEKLEAIKDLYFKARRQLQKILTSLDEGESTEKIEKYCKKTEKNIPSDKIESLQEKMET